MKLKKFQKKAMLDCFFNTMKNINLKLIIFMQMKMDKKIKQKI